MQTVYKNEKCLSLTILSYQRHMHRWQGAHTPPFSWAKKKMMFSIEA
jgi:hypothetical protein